MYKSLKCLMGCLAIIVMISGCQARDCTYLSNCLSPVKPVRSGETVVHCDYGKVVYSTSPITEDEACGR